MPRELSFSLSIGSTPLTEPEDQEMAAELFRIYQAINSLATQVDTATGGLAIAAADRPYVLPSTASKEANMSRGYGKATVDLTIGEIVHFNSAGELVKAQATGTHLLKGQGIVLENTVTDGYAPIAYRGIIKAFVGLTVGNYYFLSLTAGAISNAAPTAGNTLQYLGYAVSSTELYFCPEPRHSVS
jgi:hypothetical protein